MHLFFFHLSTQKVLGFLAERQTMKKAQRRKMCNFIHQFLEIQLFLFHLLIKDIHYRFLSLLITIGVTYITFYWIVIWWYIKFNFFIVSNHRSDQILREIIWVYKWRCVKLDKWIHAISTKAKAWFTLHNCKWFTILLNLFIQITQDVASCRSFETFPLGFYSVIDIQ